MMRLSVFLKGLPLFLVLFSLHQAWGQKDSLVLTNENIIVGEVKGMKKGVVTIETDYSDSDFKIEWGKIKTINTKTEFLITTKSGDRFNGALRPKDSVEISIVKVKDTLASFPKEEIVFLREVKSSFLSKIKASLSVGYNYTKAEDLSEFSIRTLLGYRAKRWGLNAKYNDIRSSREDAEPVERLEASLDYQFYLKHNWYTVTEISWLSNTEQNIKLRTLAKLGIGKYLIQTNSLYWGIQAGASYNNESFSVEQGETNNNSGEAFFGTELNLYDIKDLSLLTQAVVYPSLTESGRWRFDYNLDIKYDLPLNFYIKLGITLNYDNQPVKDASETDYIFQTMVGWDFN